MLHDLAHQHGESEALRGSLRIEREAFNRLFEMVPIACVSSDRTGTIVHANAAAGRLLNISPARLTGRSLVLFFQDRSSFEAALQEVNTQPDAVTLCGQIRPRERRVVEAAVSAVQGDEFSLFWFLDPAVTSDPNAVQSQTPRAAQGQINNSVPVGGAEIF